MPRIGVQRFVQVFGLLRELDAGTQVEVVAAGAVVRPAAALARPARRGVPASTPWQSGHRTSDSRASEIIGRRDHSSKQRFEPLGPAIPRVLRHRVAPPRASRVRPAPGRRRSRSIAAAIAAGISRRHEQRIHPVVQDLANGRQVGRDDGRPAAMYSNSFNGDVNRVEIAEAGLGSARMSALTQQFRDARRLDQSR